MPNLDVKSLGVQGDTAHTTTPKEQRVKHSGFLITVNTNFRPRSNDESWAMGYRLENAMRSMLTHQGLSKIITFQGEGHSYSDRYVKDVKAQFAVEVGHQAKGTRIHSHTLLHIAHMSHIRLSIPAIKQHVISSINDPRIKSVYVNIRMVRNDRNLEEYLKKDMRVTARPQSK